MPQPDLRDARERRQEELRMLEQEFDRVLLIVEDEAAVEAHEYQKVLRGGPLPAGTDAGERLNDTYRKICELRFESAELRPPDRQKRSAIDRVVGVGADESPFLRKMEERFSDQDFDRYSGREREKTERELQIISFVNGETNALLRKYGLSEFDIPAKNIHVIPSKAWDDEEGSAYYSGREQAVAVRESSSGLGFAKKVMHEMTHFKSYGALQKELDSSKFNEYRTGLVIQDRRGEGEYFRLINEAVTEELTRRMMGACASNELFQADLEETRRLMSEAPSSVDASGRPFFTSDTFFARRVPGRANGRGIEGERFTYVKERAALETLAFKLCTAAPARFSDPDAVLDAFAKAMLGGNILPIGRAVDRTFGSGTFRKIGEIADEGELLAFVDSLQTRAS